jgi:hypothetical protein
MMIGLDILESSSLVTNDFASSRLDGDGDDDGGITRVVVSSLSLCLMQYRNGNIQFTVLFFVATIYTTAPKV